VSSSSSEALPAGADRIRTRRLGLREYGPVQEAQRAFTAARDAATPDEFWTLEHAPVFTQGQAGRAEHLLAPGDVPVVQSDRGGQVTYHGPGQLVVYLLVDCRRRGLGVRALVSHIEDAIVALLGGYGIAAAARPEAPGVYVDGAKIASLGLRIRRGCSYHGLALNVAMDLEPFGRIDPCGMAGLAVTQLADLGGPADVAAVRGPLCAELARRLGAAGLVAGPEELPDA
jgi:lipoyl(octanoyl) transferase